MSVVDSVLIITNSLFTTDELCAYYNSHNLCVDAVVDAVTGESRSSAGGGRRAAHVPYRPPVSLNVYI